MTGKTPPPGTPVATGIASGSLGTGTAVDEETTLMAVPDAPEVTEQSTAVPAGPKAVATAPTGATARAAATAPAAAPITSVRRPTARRDPFRPIGIALAAILVALAGFAALSSGGDTPARIGTEPAATASPGAVAGDEVDGDDDDGGNGGNNGNGNGRGNGNGGDNGRGND